MCLRAKLRFCVESHKGAFAFTAPEHSDFAAAQAPTQADGRAEHRVFARTTLDLLRQSGKGRTVYGRRRDGHWGLFKKRRGLFDDSPAFSPKSLPFFSTPNRPRTTPAAVREGGSRLWAKHGGTWAATAPPLQRRPRGRATPRAKNARRREESPRRRWAGRIKFVILRENGRCPFQVFRP